MSVALLGGDLGNPFDEDAGVHAAVVGARQPWHIEASIAAANADIG